MSGKEKTKTWIDDSKKRENEIGNILSFTAPFCRGFERNRELNS